MSQFLFAFLSVMILSMAAFAQPVTQVTCQEGGDYGFEVRFEFAPNAKVEKVFIKRVKKDFEKDLTEFTGRRYRFDVAALGGIKGYVVEYKNPETGELSKYESPLACVKGVPSSETQAAAQAATMKKFTKSKSGFFKGLFTSKKSKKSKFTQAQASLNWGNLETEEVFDKAEDEESEL